jgi:CobQ-like glutamine amidotransferase family enzyme
MAENNRKKNNGNKTGERMVLKDTIADLSKDAIKLGEALTEVEPEDEDTLEEELFGADSESEEEAAGKTRVMNIFRPVVKIAWMYPDTLYLHGERGNVMALTRYAQELGLEPKIYKIDLGSGDFNPMKYDILFFGPGEISSFPSVMEDIGTFKRSLAEYVAAGKTMIVTGTTVAMFGERIRRFDPDAPNGLGEIMDGLCLIPIISEEREYVYGDDEDVRAEYGGYSMELVGSQIHMADYEFLENSSFTRFGSVIYGRGNNGHDGMEGVLYNNAIFTNMLGPLLVNNPWLTVRILRTVADRKGYIIQAPEPNYTMEIRSLELKKEFIDAKAGE